MGGFSRQESFQVCNLPRRHDNDGTTIQKRLNVNKFSSVDSRAFPCPLLFLHIENVLQAASEEVHENVVRVDGFIPPVLSVHGLCHGFTFGPFWNYSTGRTNAGREHTRNAVKRITQGMMLTELHFEQGLSWNLKIHGTESRNGPGNK